jgi:hypothetical protein
MDEKTVPCIAPRESLIACLPPRRTGERKVMRRAYSQVYRHRQQAGGIPSRRELGEAVLQAALLRGYRDGNEAAKQIIRDAGRILRSVQKPDGSRRYSQVGILQRANAVLAELIADGPVISAEED